MAIYQQRIEYTHKKVDEKLKASMCVFMGHTDLDRRPAEQRERPYSATISIR